MSTRGRPAVPAGVLLVHGAWHTGATWDPVAAALRERGITVAVAELHRGSLTADTAAAAEALAELSASRPAVACGHSYGGTVITGLPTDQLSHLVYLCATMPDTSETSLGQMAGAPPTPLHAAMRWLPDTPGTAVIDPDLAGEVFYGHSSPAVRAGEAAALVAQDMSAGHEPPASVAWRSVPSTYVICADDQALHPDLQRRLAGRATEAVTWDSDHAAYLTCHADLVELLSELALSPGR